MLDLRAFSKCGIEQILKYVLFLFTNALTYNALTQICSENLLKKTTFRTVLRQSWAISCRNLRINHENLRICDLRTGTPKKLRNSESAMSPRIWRSLKIVSLPMPTSEEHLGNYYHKILLNSCQSDIVLMLSEYLVKISLSLLSDEVKTKNSKSN